MPRKNLLILLIFCGCCLHARPAAAKQIAPPQPPTNAPQPSPRTPLELSPAAWEALRDECERRAVSFFWHEADPQTGLVKDRAGNFAPDNYDISSTAATGFGLAALAVGVERGWLKRAEAYERARATLRFLRDTAAQEHGWFYHFVDPKNGARAWKSEASSIDTALLLAGALLAGRYFHGTEVEALADEIYRRVDFPWMLTNGGARPDELLLCHGWKPERKFLPYRWDRYAEHMVLYLLAIGSPTHPIPARSWEAWARPQGEYAGFTTFESGPLFVHQFSQAFVDFRHRRDRPGFDYWDATLNATRANYQFCRDQAPKFRTYREGFWGLSACDGPNGYRAYGAPPGMARHDGTVAPLAVLAAAPCSPELVWPVLAQAKADYGDKLWGRYGFSDAFNLDRDWFDRDVIGIDLGCALLMLENDRNGWVWQEFTGLAPIQSAMRAVGFNLEPAAQPTVEPAPMLLPGLHSVPALAWAG